MRILRGSAQVELVFQKSRFLGTLQEARDPEQARSLLKDAKARYADATHVVHAFRTGSEGSETWGCSDDGEPSGTAGRPVLDVLKGEGGGHCLLTVVRWFGGTKLGTGGLVRAYGDTAKAVIAAASWEEQRLWIRARISVAWAEHRLLKNELAAADATVETETFREGVDFEVLVPAEAFARLQARTIDLTRGRSRWEAD